jgi:hypothetical protein
MANCREPVRTALVEDVLQHMRKDARDDRDRQKMIPTVRARCEPRREKTNRWELALNVRNAPEAAIRTQPANCIRNSCFFTVGELLKLVRSWAATQLVF